MISHRVKLVVKQPSERDAAPRGSVHGADRFAVYEAEKSRIADTAASSTEYEDRLRALVLELGL